MDKEESLCTDLLLRYHLEAGNLIHSVLLLPAAAAIKKDLELGVFITR